MMIFVLIFMNLLLWNIFTPIFEAADEPGYYQQAYFLAHERQMPNLNNPPQNAGVMTYPPTYYLPLVPIVWLTQSPSINDPIAIQERENFRQGWRYQKFNRFQHSSAEVYWRWDKLGWAIRLMRLVANLWGIGTIILVYLTARQLFSNENKAMLATLFVGFNPMFAHLNSTVIVVNLLIFLASLMWYWLIKWRSFTFKKAVVLGSVIGLATITKATGLLLLPIAGTRMLMTRAEKKDWLGLVLGVGLTAGWWFVRNIFLYGSLLATDKVIATTGTRAFMIQQLGPINYWVGFFTSQWATFWTGYGWSAVYFSKTVLGILLVLVALAIWGIAKSREKKLRFFIGAVIFWWSMLMMAHAKFPTFHAKDLYPMIIPISLLVVAGWDRIWQIGKLPKLGNRWLMGVILILFLINAAYLLLDVSPKLFGRQSF